MEELPGKRRPPSSVAGALSFGLESGSQVRQGKEARQLVMAPSTSLAPLSHPHHNGKKKLFLF